MKRNAKYSPLIRLPAELRNVIFRMVVSDQHVHISVKRLPKRIDRDNVRVASSSISSLSVSQPGGGIYCTT